MFSLEENARYRQPHARQHAALHHRSYGVKSTAYSQVTGETEDMHKYHLLHARRALGANTTAEAITRAIVLGILEIDIDASNPPLLTPRQLDVVTLMAAGHTNAAIGEKLGTAGDTVKAQLSFIFRKLGVACREEAVRVLFERGTFVTGRDALAAATESQSLAAAG